LKSQWTSGSEPGSASHSLGEAPDVSSSTMTQPVTSIIGNGSSLGTPAAYELERDEEPNMPSSGLQRAGRDSRRV